MTRKSLAVALLLLPTAASAEWRTVAESAIGRMSYDTASVHAQGNRAQMRYRIDFAGQARAGAPRSAVMDVVLDCPSRTMGLVAFTSYDQPEGKGKTIEHQAFATPKMDPVRAASTGVPLLKAACGDNAEPHPAQPAAASAAPGNAPAAPATGTSKAAPGGSAK